MTEPASVPPPLPSVATKPKATWWKFLIAAFAVAFLLLRLLASVNTVDLEVRRIDFMFNDDGKVLDITNIGKAAINITGVTANDRDDCKLKKLVFVEGQDPSYPIPLKVGETQRFSGSCPVVRATVETDQGSNTYSFSRK
jgi:hypothetical protein